MGTALYVGAMHGTMKHCPTCGYDSPDDAEFCMRCGAYFPGSRGGSASPSVPPQAQAPEPEPVVTEVDAEAAMDEGFRLIAEDDFAGAVARWSAALKAGMKVSDETYARILDGCVGSIMRTVSKTGTHSRTGVADLALLLDERELMTDILSGLEARAEHIGYQRELMNTANEYMFMAIEAFAVYTDLEDLQGICDEAARVMEGMLSRVDSLEPTESKHDPKAFLQNYIQFFTLLSGKLAETRGKTDPAVLEAMSDYWAERSGSRFPDVIIGAANMNAQLIGAGWMGSKLATKARDMQLDAFIAMYMAPSKK